MDKNVVMLNPVVNAEADLYKYGEFYNHEKSDFQVLTEYIGPQTLFVIVRRIDSGGVGWSSPIQVFLVVHPMGDTCGQLEPHTQIVTIGETRISESFVKVEVPPNYTLFSGAEPIYRRPTYMIQECPEPKAISRAEFNGLFGSDIVTLPECLYATGIRDGVVYMYNESYSHYYEIIHSIKHILRVAITYRKNPHFYFITCWTDGYLEWHYPGVRDQPLRIGDTQMAGEKWIHLSQEDTYPVFHSREWILGQSVQKGLAKTLAIPDRHYFYCNLYHCYRSFHRGIPFSTKIPKVVYASRRANSTIHNFVNRRDIEKTQRAYFYDDVLPSVCDIVECPISSWMETPQMVNYKYVLDIDGIGCTWDATAWKMNSGSVIFKTESGWRQWFYDKYLPYVHYIPISDDFHDLREKYEWCEAHPQECAEIVANAKVLFQEVYSFQNVVEYTLGVIDQLIQ